MPSGIGGFPPKVEVFYFADDGVIPNNPTLPLLVYRGVLRDRTDRAEAFEVAFRRNGWTGSWRNGIFPFPHFHSTAHEVLGIAEGDVTVQLGGANGRTFTLHPGDAVVIPAGVGHQKHGCEGELVVIGAYPDGHDVDLCRAVRDEHDRAVANVARVTLPGTDPLFGRDGPLAEHWPGRPTS
ncbi:cupin domain-containing protein [Marinivivus vitaminiproducens]|uniref:cupin domain-containing protein n=1 Tax=Marinivivus vitaminiproducens TaxID=3035935 RepID=UPI00279AC9EB|nr:cupin domain-containing protein [Geminicoccaceae bacterium SCSIO 64248]